MRIENSNDDFHVLKHNHTNFDGPLKSKVTVKKELSTDITSNLF
jgi:hypothetical protein